MPKYIPPKQKLGMLTNHDKRNAYMSNDGNWTVIETADNVKIEQLKYTPFVRIQIYTYHKELGKQWITTRFAKLTQDELISVTSYTENDIREYIKQQAWTHKQEVKGL